MGQPISYIYVGIGGLVADLILYPGFNLLLSYAQCGLTATTPTAASSEIQVLLLAIFRLNTTTWKLSRMFVTNCILLIDRRTSKRHLSQPIENLRTKEWMTQKVLFVTIRTTYPMTNRRSIPIDTDA